MTEYTSRPVAQPTFDSSGGALEHGAGAAALYEKMAAGRISTDDLVSCSAFEPMSTMTPPATTAGTTEEELSDNKTLPGVFGVDCGGALHRYERVSGRLVVTDRDGTVLHAAEMDIDELRGGWIPFIGSERGWIDHWLDSDELFDATERLGAALKALDAAEGER